MTATPRPPTRLAARFARYVAGFGIGVAIGLAPFLGRLDIPLAAPLLHLLPVSLQNMAIPLSGALMGLVAVAVQWYAREKVSKQKLRTMFRRTAAAGIVSFLLLLVLNTLVVVPVPYLGGEKSYSFLVGFVRPDREPCLAGISNAECINRLSFDAVAVRSFWGERNVQFAALSMTLSYLAFTSTFGVLIGLLLVRDERERAAKPRASGRRGNVSS